MRQQPKSVSSSISLLLVAAAASLLLGSSMLFVGVAALAYQGLLASMDKPALWTYSTIEHWFAKAFAFVLAFLIVYIGNARRYGRW